MKFYCVINDSNVVVETKQVKGPIDAADHIEIASLDDLAGKLGQVYDAETGTFSDPE